MPRSYMRDEGGGPSEPVCRYMALTMKGRKYIIGPQKTRFWKPSGGVFVIVDEHHVGSKLPHFDQIEIHGGRIVEWNDELCEYQELPDIIMERVGKWIKTKFVNAIVCPYCKTPLEKAIYRRVWHDCEDNEDPCRTIAWSCPKCIYWQVYWIDLDERERGGAEKYVVSKLQTFKNVFPEGVYAEISQAIRRKPNLWHTIDPRNLEKLVAAIFKLNYRDSEAIHVGKSHDGGVDVVFVNSDLNKWLIQVKRRSQPNASEGVNTIKNLLATMVENDTPCGIVVSTASHFTYQAYHTTSKAAQFGWYIRLIDKGILDKMLDPLLPDRPWLSILDGFDKKAAGYISHSIPSIMQGRLRF